jgi:hypothetical protein
MVVQPFYFVLGHKSTSSRTTFGHDAALMPDSRMAAQAQTVPLPHSDVPRSARCDSTGLHFQLKKNEKTWTMNRLKIWMGTIPFENRRHLHVRLVNSWYIAASDVHR